MNAHQEKPRTTLHPFSRGTFVLLIVCLSTGLTCRSPLKPGKNWEESSFHHLSYEVPASWVQIRSADMISYRRKGIRMNRVTIRRFQQGDPYPRLEKTVDLSENIWELADRSLADLKSSPEYLEVQLIERRPFPQLGKRAYRMLVRTRNREGLNRKHWIIGAVFRNHYYWISLEAEEHGHLSAVRKSFKKFMRRLAFKQDGESPRDKQE